jgi:hypothetical protein
MLGDLFTCMRDGVNGGRELSMGTREKADCNSTTHCAAWSGSKALSLMLKEIPHAKGP